MVHVCVESLRSDAVAVYSDPSTVREIETFLDGWKEVESSSRLDAYVPVSAYRASCAVARFRRSASITASCAEVLALPSRGSAMVARIPRITITTSSSIKVNPRGERRAIICRSCMEEVRTEPPSPP
jgi:hypothetical protein